MEKEEVDIMNIKTLSQKDFKRAVELYIQERDRFCWLISFEEFVKDYLAECEYCRELFVTDMDEHLCEECQHTLESEKDQEEDDFNTGFFEANKEHYLYNI